MIESLYSLLSDISKDINLYYNNFWKDFNLEDIRTKRIQYLKDFISKLK